MWPCIVIVPAPIVKGLASVIVAGEQVLIQTFVAQTSVEAFDKSILHGFAGLNVVPFNLGVLAPFENGV